LGKGPVSPGPSSSAADGGVEGCRVVWKKLNRIVKWQLGLAPFPFRIGLPLIGRYKFGSVDGLGLLPANTYISRPSRTEAAQCPSFYEDVPEVAQRRSAHCERSRTCTSTFQSRSPMSISRMRWDRASCCRCASSSTKRSLASSRVRLVFVRNDPSQIEHSCVLMA